MKKRRGEKRKGIGLVRTRAMENRPRDRRGRFPVTGIGASAGGLEAFEELLQHLPSDTGMAFLLVQHLDPTHGSQLPEILARHATMPVTEVKDGMRILPNRIFVIPPNADMSVRDSALHLEPRRDSATRHMPVNVLFRSLANEQKNSAIGVILSGTASDGAAGMKAIKAEGGITFAQDAASAKYSGMPQSAIATGAVDFVLPPKEIARHLARLGNHRYVRSPQPAKEEPGSNKETGSAFQQLLGLLKKSFGVDFSRYKVSTIDRRIRRRMALRPAETLEDYLRYARNNPDELRVLFQDMFTGVTEFFRDPGMFKAAGKTIFSSILKNRSAESPIRIWVPGCSTGEEVYSIAISLLECAAGQAKKTSIQIFGTDVNEEAIKKARAGRYGKEILAHVSRSRLRQFFSKADDGFQINKEVRDLCVFAKHDILRDPPFTHLDLLSCRNLMIYLTTDSQRKLIPMFHYALKAKGLLVVGSAETIGGSSELFSLQDQKYRFYAKREGVSHRPRFEPPDEWAPKVSSPDLAGKARALPSDFELQREAADRLILNYYGPPAVLVNKNMDILHFRGRTGPYLEPAPGTPTMNLLQMAREGLLEGLRASLDAARKKDAAVTKEGLLVESDGRERVVDIHIVPIKAPGSKDRTFLVMFDDATSSKEVSVRAVAQRERTTPAGGDIRVARLKQELAATKAYLQSVVESRETSNEELRSLNEEIMSSNEELRSTTEELETSNEELRSTNEELHNRTQDLSQANNDILNLLSSMNVSVLVLDRDLRIRRFTPIAEKVLHITSGDVGRPVTSIRLPVIMPDLKRHIAEAIRGLQPSLADVQGQDGRWYELQIHPYITEKNRTEGAVIALTDVSELIRLTANLAVAGEDLQHEQVRRSGAEHAVHAWEERFRVVADSLPEPVADIAPDERYRFTNEAFNKMFAVTPKQLSDLSVRGLLGEETYGMVRPCLEKALRGRSASFEGYLSYHQGRRQFVHIDFVPHRDDGGESHGLYFLLRDLTQLKEAEEQEMFRRIVECAPDGVLLVNHEGKIAMMNSEAERLFGYSRQDLIGRQIEMLVPARLREEHVRQRSAYLHKPAARSMGRGLELSAVRKDGSEFPVEISLSPIETMGGIFVSSTIRDITDRKQLAEQRRWAAVLEERSRMARDVHDTLAQGFTGIVLNLEAVETTAADLPEEVRNRIRRAREVARESLEEARRSVLALSSSLPRNSDLASSIGGLVDRYRSSTEPRVGLSVRGTPRRLPSAIEEALLRITQQAIDNALQHARASSIRVELALNEKQAQIKITDDGQGFDVKRASRGFGLTGMRDRAKELGAKFEIKSRLGRGTRVEIRIPYPSTPGLAASR